MKPKIGFQDTLEPVRHLSQLNVKNLGANIYKTPKTSDCFIAKADIFSSRMLAAEYNN